MKNKKEKVKNTTCIRSQIGRFLAQLFDEVFAFEYEEVFRYFGKR